MSNIKYTKNTPVYNEKRYSKPYIALCDDKGKAIRWGEWIGTAGFEGILEISAPAGSILMKGQKDHRGNNSAPSYGVLQSDGSVEWTSKAAAVKAYRENASTSASEV